MLTLFQNRRNKTQRRPIYPGKRRPSPTRKTTTTTISSTPLSWRQYESKTLKKISPSPSSSPSPSPSPSDECHLQEELSYTAKSCPGNQLAYWGLSKYTLDNGRTLNIHSDAFTKKIGDMDCTKLKSKLRTLLPYLTCDVCKKVKKIQLYHHDIKPSQFSMVPLLFASMPQLREIHLGSNAVPWSPKRRNAFQTTYNISSTEHDTPYTGKYISFKRI